MEENINSEMLDDELLVETEEEDEEDTDINTEELDEDNFDEEEYDFNDEDDEELLIDDENDEDEESTQEAEESEESEEKPEEKPEEKTEEKTEEKPEEKPAAEADETRAVMEDMLTRLGYEGTYEEKMAAYRADSANADKKSEDAPVDYHAMAEADLRDINAAFGTNFEDFSGFDDIARFASLRVRGATALEAFRATQKSVNANAEEPTVSKPSKDHIVPLPTGSAEGGAGKLSAEDRHTLSQLHGLYPELSKKDLMKSLNRVKKTR